MDALEAILIILALKIPIVGLISFVYWLMKEPETEESTEQKVRAMPPRLPEPGDRRPRRRGPHGGAAQPLPSPRRDPHPAATPRESAPAPSARSIREVGRSDAVDAAAE
jgi:hypothetical protein